LPPLKIVVVYDGIEDLIRVDEIWSRVVARFQDKIQITSSAWNFTLLTDPQLRERAALRTAEADFVVFSASGKSEPPDHVRLWIETWLPWKKGRRDALVAMLDYDPARCTDALPLRNYLQRMAEKSGMKYFCNADQQGSPTNPADGFFTSGRDAKHERGPNISKRRQVPRCD
jgi:hypothetical protein